MFKHDLIIAAALCAFAAPTLAAPQAELDALRAEFDRKFDALQADYEARLKALESRVQAAEIQADQDRATAQMAEQNAIDVEIESRVREELKKYFRPEFINRIDETIIFHRLSADDLKKIVDIQVEYLRQRLADRQISLRLTDAAGKQLADDGYDPLFGARPLKRLIQREIENPLARRLLAGEFTDGDTIEVDSSGERFVFNKT